MNKTKRVQNVNKKVIKDATNDLAKKCNIVLDKENIKGKKFRLGFISHSIKCYHKSKGNKDLFLSMVNSKYTDEVFNKQRKIEKGE